MLFGKEVRLFFMEKSLMKPPVGLRISKKLKLENQGKSQFDK